MEPSKVRETVKTTCCYCGVGCGVLIHRQRDGGVSLEGDPDHPVNRGKLCSKGINLLQTVMDQSDRLLFPQLRDSKAHPLRQVGWDEALERAAKVFSSLTARYGPDSVGFYISGQCLTEEYYLANKIAKGFLGTNNVDTNSRLCMSSAVVGYKMALGEDSVPCCYEDLDLADLYLVAGANPAYCHPILFRRVESRILGENPPAKMIVVDPRKTQTASLAALYLPICPGTDVVLFNAWARLLIEGNKIDNSFIKSHTEGFEALREQAFKRTVSEAAELCGVPEEDLRKGAEMIGESRGFMSLWAMGLNQSTIAVNKNLSLINLHLITGRIGTPGNGPFSLTGQPNAMGGREVGGMANLLSAHRDLGNPEHRKEVAQYWGVPSVPEKPGFTAGEMMDALIDGRLKALWIICTNPLVSWPDLAKAEKALKSAKFLVVQDISSRSDTLAYADLILPAAGWMEKEGTMTNSERRISHLGKVLDPPGEALPDSEILIRFAHKMGWGASFNYPSFSDVYQEHAGLTKNTRIDVSGLDYWRLKTEGTFQWPVPSGKHPGTPRLFTDGQFYRAGGRAKIHGVPDENPSVSTDPRYPLVLTTGRIRDQWHTMTRSGKVNKLMSQEPESFLEICPQDAEIRGLDTGSMAEVTSPRGTVRVRVRVTDSIRKGVVFMPIHWGRILGAGEVRANNLTEARWDPISKEPDLKYSSVEVKLYQTTPRRIMIVGAGAAAAAFIQAYRKENSQDALIVFSGEPHPFYNRIRLPEFIEGKAEWNSLVTLEENDLQKLNIQIRSGRKVVAIDKGEGRILDDLDCWHSYDILVLATGSRPYLPKGVPLSLAGIHTLRTKEDAQDILTSVGPDKQVVVVGGGLLGLEVAAAFMALGRTVHLVQRSSRLMDRQLDEVAGELLKEELLDRGLIFHFHDEVSIWRGTERLEEVILSSGTRIQNAVLIYAVGTVPNAELGKACGLESARGLVVDGRMRTSDPRIFALGEVAEFEGQLFGITSAAEEQAVVAARFLTGDVQAVYKGSLSQNLLKIEGLSLVSLGQIKSDEDDPDTEVLTLLDRESRYYKKLLVKNNRLIGALMLGDKSEFLDWRETIKQGLELGVKRQKLLRSEGSGGGGRPREGKVVCSCFNVDEGAFKAAWGEGGRTLDEMVAKTGAGSGCGSCRPEIKQWLDQYSLKTQDLKTPDLKTQEVLP